MQQASAGVARQLWCTHSLLWRKTCVGVRVVNRIGFGLSKCMREYSLTDVTISAESNACFFYLRATCWAFLPLSIGWSSSAGAARTPNIMQ